jgi:lipopolysaccharide export system permease protein
MPIIDKYILKKYFTSFIFTLFILIPIAIAIDISDKIGRFIDQSLGAKEIIDDYYIPFIINYGNTFMPLALFISTILFTSKLASNTEIVAIHGAGISFTRFLRPYLIGAMTIAIIAFLANHFVVPQSNKTLEEFTEAHLRKNKNSKSNVSNVSLQLSEKDFVYFRSFNLLRNAGFDFTYEHFEGLQLKYKIFGKNIKWNEKDSTFSLRNYKKRKIYAQIDSIESGRKLDTTFNFLPKDLLYVDYLAKEMPSFQLSEHIKRSAKRGVRNLNKYKVELFRRTSIPISAIILTIMAVALAARKRRGGVGINLAAGISLMFAYVFFMKVSEVLGSGVLYNPLLMVWLPNIIFGVLALYLYINAKR